MNMVVATSLSRLLKVVLYACLGLRMRGSPLWDNFPLSETVCTACRLTENNKQTSLVISIRRLPASPAEVSGRAHVSIKQQGFACSKNP